jgi:hypothetical protein
MRFWLGIAYTLLVFGCGAPTPPDSAAQTPLAPAPSMSGSKRIVSDGSGGFILPDGTPVATDEKGGFRLPNGGYVAALADGLLLPNGVRCAPDDAGGYVCP